MSSLKDFVRGIRQRHSQRAGQVKIEAPAGMPLGLLDQLFQKMQGQLHLEDEKARLELAQLILPKVLDSDSNGHICGVKHDLLKEYAFALGHMVGLLAGLSLKEHALDGAVESVMSEAKANAHRTHEVLVRAGITKPDSGPEHRQPQTQAQNVTQQLSMIADLERQAEGESDAATKAALRAMADGMRRELSSPNGNGTSKKEAA